MSRIPTPAEQLEALKAMSQPLQYQVHGAKTCDGPVAINDPKSIESTLKMIQNAREHMQRAIDAFNAAEGEIRRLSGYYQAEKEGF